MATPSRLELPISWTQVIFNDMKSIIENILSLQKDYSSKNTDSMKKRGILIRNSLPEILESFEHEIVQSAGIDVKNLTRDGSGNKTEIPWVRFSCNYWLVCCFFI